MQFILPHKASFITYDKDVKIFDDRKKEFYFFKWDYEREYLLFNLPKGKYYTENKIQKIKNFDFTLNELPPPETNSYQIIKKINIIPASNNHKGSIIIDTINGKADIYYDKSLDDLPYFCKDFIIGHELGHLYYISEDLCDVYSRNLLLKLGYNPSQLNKAIAKTLPLLTAEAHHRYELSLSDNKNAKPKELYINK